MSAVVRLNTFVLDRLLGEGATGQVWAGRDAQHGVAVAIKVLSRRPVEDGMHRFQEEVRAVASLDHPHIVWVLDHGVVPPGIDGMPEGAPYLVTELASGGSLAEQATHQWQWTELYPVLRALLDALAHAHARGVIHRDLKPENVLVCTGVDDRPGVKIADFGIAWAMEGDDRSRVSAGTRQYMAPEQLTGQWRRFGPWTDLYALGCVIHRLVRGAPPFAHHEGMALAQAHAFEAPPPLWGPPGLDAIVSRLLEKRPERRFSSAADVAWALEGVENGVADQPQPPPFPTSWRTPTARVVSRLMSAGVRLFGLRPMHFVGRRAARDALWKALADVHGGGGPRGVVMRGAAGAGKTRLAEWLSHRAQELGAASAIRVDHLRSGGTTTGLAGMLLRTSDPLVEEWDPDPQIPRRERHTALLAWLRSRVAERPAVLWIDDAQWGLEAVQFGQRLLDTDLPVLVLLTVEEEALLDRPLARRAIEAVQERCERIDLGPLPPEEARQLIASMLVLDATLAAAVEQRAAGNPLFAVQLIGEQVARGNLRVDPDGLALAEGAAFELPADLRSTWLARLGRIVELDGPDGDALEIAAVLGHEVDQETWKRACAVPPSATLERLRDARLFEEVGTRVRFAHAMLRESLITKAREAGRLASHHARCAVVLSKDEPGTLGWHLAEAGQLAEAIPLLELGIERANQVEAYARVLQLVEVLALAIDGSGVAIEDPVRGRISMWRVQILRNQGRLDGAVRQAEALLHDATAHGWSALGIQARTELADAARLRGDLAEATRICEAALAEVGDPHLAADPAQVLTEVLLDQGRFQDALALSKQIRGWTTQPLLLAHCDFQTGRALFSIGEYESSIAYLRAASASYAEKRRWLGVGNCEVLLGDVFVELGDLDEAELTFRSALAHFERMGSGNALIATINLALVDMGRGHHADALASIVAVLVTLRREGRDGAASSILLAAACCAAELGQWADVRRHLDEGWQLQQQTGLVETMSVEHLRTVARRAEADGDSALETKALEMLAVLLVKLGQA